MTRRPAIAVVTLAAGALLVTLAVGCDRGPAIEDASLLVRLSTPSREVELGRGFPLTVVRVVDRDLVATAFDERSLAPLVTRLVSTSERTDDRRVEETRRYLAHAFSLGGVTIPGPAITAVPRAGGTARTTKAEPLQLDVRRALDPKAPGAPEEPGPFVEPPAAPSSWLRLVSIGSVVLAIGLVAWRRRMRAARRTPVPPPPPPPPVGAAADAAALAALARLRVQDAVGASDDVRPLIAASDVVRAYVTARLRVATAERTTVEILGDLARPGVPQAHAALLAGVLGTADLVKFAEHRPTATDRARFFDDAERFVRATTPSEAASPGSASS